MNDYTPHDSGPNPMPNPYAYGSGQSGPYSAPTPDGPLLPHPNGPLPPKKKRTGLKVFAVCSAVLVATIGGCTAALYNGASDAIDNLPNTVPTTEIGTPYATTAPVKPGVKRVSPPAVLRDGLLLVGKDVKAGTFRATVPEGPLGSAVPSCYVARLSGTSGELSEIITNHNWYPGDVITLTVKASDKAVEVRGCGKWLRLK